MTQAIAINRPNVEKESGNGIAIAQDAIRPGCGDLSRSRLGGKGRREMMNDESEARSAE
jgi:hypothetical protein